LILTVFAQFSRISAPAAMIPENRRISPDRPRTGNALLACFQRS
jgi:hypothetical protein